MRVAHLTSVHPRYDSRIFWKQCRSLAAAGHDVSLVVADGLPDEVCDGVKIAGVRKLPSRWKRMLVTPRRVLAKVLELDADIYHLHDPELLTVALALKRAGKRVVFDSHEDVPRQILSKHYLWKPIRSSVSWLAAAYERFVCSRLDAVVAATPTIREKFLRINPRTIDVNNYPLLGEFDAFSATDDSPKDAAVCYVGGISAVRGIKELVRALALTSGSMKLLLAGSFIESEVSAEVRTMEGWRRVEELGWLGRDGVGEVMQRSLAGIVTLHPTLTYMDALPVKMFEYMSAGLPVIASDFPLWRRILDDAKCGICVDPMDPKAIAGAIDWIAAHPEEARRMGENGQRAVRERYNWHEEGRKLIGLYRSLS